MDIEKSSFYKSGLDWILVRRDEGKVLYRQQLGKTPVGFVVARVEWTKKKVFRGKVVEPVLSSRINDSDFGRSAWQFQEYSKAKEKYESITANDQKPQD